MKTTLLISAFFLLLLSSCRKSIEDRIIGQWKLKTSFRQKLFDRDYFNTGFEQGIFTFNENGTATYESTTDTLAGYWYAERYVINNQSETGNYRELRIELVNFTGNQYLFWEFDNFNFRNSWQTLRTEDFSLSHNKIYEFVRQ